MPYELPWAPHALKTSKGSKIIQPGQIPCGYTALAMDDRPGSGTARGYQQEDGPNGTS